MATLEPKRRDFRRSPWKTAGLLLGLAGCASGTEGVPSDIAFERRPNLPAILTLMPDSASARETYEGMVSELGNDFDLIPQIVRNDASPNDLVRIVREMRPRAIVVMNNPILRLYRRYRVIASPSQRSIPAIAVLISFLRETSEGVDNLTGVIYEVPLVTSLINLRVLLDQPVRRVGVLHRPIFSSFVEEQRRLSAAEGFELVGLSVSGKRSSEIADGLRTLRAAEKVDAIWVLNDNSLLKRDLLVKGWLPGLRGNRTPVIVNVRSLLSEKVSFGTFAVLPDHRALGTQAGQMLASIADEDWELRFPGEFEYPIAVEKVLDLGFARQYLALRETELKSVDKLVE